MIQQECPPPASIDPKRIGSLPPDPLGPLPDEFQDDQLLRTIDSLKFSRYGLVWNYTQFCFLYNMYGKMSLEEASIEPAPATGDTETAGNTTTVSESI